MPLAFASAASTCTSSLSVRLAHCDVEELLERIRAEWLAGFSFRQIARRLERDWIATPNDGPTWPPSTVRAYMLGGWGGGREAP